ncbi:MAG: RnfABCDGE type electron transport complex subunit B [Clostridiales bacterium]|nr:RnfABCDGE type electron transport complex subunit B [Clostridiales bacterium]
MPIFLNIIVPILIVAALAGIFAFCLSFLGDKLAVDRDARIDDIERNLAGANCGGCGYPGCAQFAEALFRGETELSRCNPTPPENKKNIAEILGMGAFESEQTVAVVHCAGGNRAADKYSYQGFGDCRTAEIIAGGSKACEYGCMGLCTCVHSCRNQSVSICKDTGVSVVDRENCTSCGACVAACPKKIIGRIPKTARLYIACSNLTKGKEVVNVCKVGCIACGKCEKGCPKGAITLADNLAAIDYNKCIGCMKCAADCPRGCILPIGDGVRRLEKVKAARAKKQQ